MEDLPKIKLEIEGMRHSIIHHFGQYQDSMSDAVEKAMDRAIAKFDYGVAVEIAANEIIESSIKAFFSYGEGREIIRDAIHKAMGGIFKTDKE